MTSFALPSRAAWAARMRRGSGHVRVPSGTTSIYSVRPTATASVSTPLTWAEVEKGVAIEAFRLDNVRARIEKVGDLWKPLNAAKGRVNLGMFFGS